MESGSAIDVTASPELRHIAEEVEATGRERLLVRDGQALARVVPLNRSRRSRSGSSGARRYEAFRSAAGAWADVDTDRLLADIYRDRASADRPPADL